MTVITLGSIALNDFSNLILTDLQRTVTYSAVTIVYDNITSDQLNTYASGTSKNWIFLKRHQKYIFDKEGIIELGDGYIMTPATDTVNLKDRITVDGETYQVTSSGENIVRHFNGGTIYKYAVMKKLDGTQT